MTAAPVRFGIVGSGWRSDSFLRISREAPSLFEVAGLVSRSAGTRAATEAAWGVPGFAHVDELVDVTRPEFVVLSVPRTVVPGIVEHLVDRGVPVLTETPPAIDLGAAEELFRRVAGRGVVQVAEQYHRSPVLAAQLAIARSGRLGTVSQAMVAQCHDYHGVSVLRRALGVRGEAAIITASVFESPLVAGPDRTGDPVEERIVTARQLTARFDFGDRLGIYDFAPEQYFSWIRANRLLVRGDRGEIRDGEVRSLESFDHPVVEELRRVSTGEGGNLEGMFLRGIQLGAEWVFANPFMPSRLNDDEIAIASMLLGMREHIGGGPDVYSLAEASQDLYLALVMKEAAATGAPVRTSPRAWADALAG
ncbi:MAG: Gfo/Idh/MocA family oxidoreductase [Protaetiibacter sp.]